MSEILLAFLDGLWSAVLFSFCLTGWIIGIGSIIWLIVTVNNWRKRK